MVPKKGVPLPKEFGNGTLCLHEAGGEAACTMVGFLPLLLTRPVRGSVWADVPRPRNRIASIRLWRMPYLQERGG